MGLLDGDIGKQETAAKVVEAGWLGNRYSYRYNHRLDDSCDNEYYPTIDMKKVETEKKRSRGALPEEALFLELMRMSFSWP